MQIEVESVERLRLADGSPVRAASAVAPFGDGFLVAQDDAHARRLVPRGVGERRPAAAGGRRARGVRRGVRDQAPQARPRSGLRDRGRRCAGGAVAGLGLAGGADALVAAALGRRGSRRRRSPTWRRSTPPSAAALAVPPDALNLEGACLVGDALRWYHRGLPSAGVPAGSVDLDPAAAVAAALGRTEPRRRGGEQPAALRPRRGARRRSRRSPTPSRFPDGTSCSAPRPRTAPTRATTDRSSRRHWCGSTATLSRT